MITGDSLFPNATTSASGDPRIEGLRSGSKWTGPNLTFSFFAGGTYYGTEANPGSVSDAVKNNVRFILNDIIAPVINLTFTEVTDTSSSFGQLRFLTSSAPSYAYAYYPSSGSDTSSNIAGDVHLNPANDVAGTDFNSRNNSFRSGPGSHGFGSLIHEIGHALGLSHPFGHANALPTAQDNQDNTVMTYTTAGNSPATFMSYDLLALQYSNGANTSTRSGDTTYVFTQVDQFSPGSGMTNTPNPIFTEWSSRMKHTLWDGGGVDTVDMGGLPTLAGGYRIDIQAGGWMTTNAAFNSVSYTGGKVTSFGTRIALSGVTIENVIVSRSSDTIYLNGAANRVSGYTPGVATGADVIHGSNQLDTLDLTKFAKASVVETQVGNDLVVNLGGSNGTVTIKDYFAVTSGNRINILYQTVTIVADPTSLRAGETATITFTLGAASTNFIASDVTVIGGTLSGFAGSGTSYTATFTPTPSFQGTGSVGVAAGVFTTGGWPNEAAQVQIAIDALVPTVAITRNGSGTITFGGSDTVTFTLSEASTNFAVGDVTVTGGTLSGFAGSGTSYTATFTPTGGFVGTATIAVSGAVFTDPAGNPNAPSSTLSIPVDTVSPTVAITRSGSGTITIGGSDTVTFTLSEASTNFIAGDVTFTGGTLSGFSGSGTVYTATFTPAAGFQGQAVVSVAVGAFTSALGNANQAGSLSLPVDTIAPSLTIIRSGSGTLTIGVTTLITFTLSEASTNFTLGDVTVTGGTLSGFAGSGTSYTATFTPTGGFAGTATITVSGTAFTDPAGNPNTLGSTLSIPVDTVAPTVAITRSGSGTIAAGGSDTITFALSEASTNFAVGDITVTGGTLSGFAGSGTSYTATFTPTGGFVGTATIAVPGAVFTNPAGNPNAPSSTLSIPVDTVSPAVAITRAGAGTVVSGATVTITFTLSTPATNFAAGDVTVTGGTLSGFSGSGTVYTATFTPAAAFQGQAVISVAAGAFTSALGNANQAGSLSLPVDTIAPSLTIIRSGSGTLKIGGTTLITFTLSEASTNFAAGDVTVTGGTLSGFSGSGTVYTATLTPTGGFVGTATIAVSGAVFTDPAGNPNTPSSTLSIPVDTVAPTVAITRSGSGTIAIGGSNTVTFTLSEASTNFAVGDVTVTGGTLSGFAGSGTSYTATFTPTGGFVGTATIAVPGAVFTNPAGNPNTPSSTLSIPVDTFLPTVTITRAGAGTVASGATVTITFTLSTPATNFLVTDVTVTGGTLSGFSGSGTVYTATFTPAAGFQGQAVISVAAGAFTSALGNASQAGSLSLPVDTIAPSLTIIRSGSGTLKIGGTTLITFTLSEASTNFGVGDVTVTGGTLSGFAGSGTSYTATFTPTGGFVGTATIAVSGTVFTDPAGNPNTLGSTLSIPVDTVAPTVAITRSGSGTITVGGSNIVTFTLSEASTNFAVGDITVTGGTLSGFSGSGTVYTATFTPAAQFQGLAAVRILANGFTDLAGNGNTASNLLSLAVNTLTPSIIGFRATPGTANLGIGGSVLIEADFSERVTPGGSFVLHLDSGGIVTMVVGPAGLSSHGYYTAQAGDFSLDLDVVKIVSNGSVKNTIGNPLSEALPVPTLGLAGRHAISVDGRVKLLSQGPFSTDPTRVPDAKSRFKWIPIRFNTPVYGLNLASLRLFLNGNPLPLTGARLTGSGMSYTLEITRWGASPVGIFKLSIAPGGGGIKAIGSNAPVSDQVLLYWGYKRSIGMVPNAPGGLAPQRLIREPLRTSVVIGWQQPAGNGGGAILSSIVQYRVAGTATWQSLRVRVPGTSTSATIPGVGLNRLYEFRVAAVNSAGRSPFASSGVVGLRNLPVA